MVRAAGLLMLGNAEYPTRFWVLFVVVRACRCGAKFLAGTQVQSAALRDEYVWAIPS